MTQKDNKYACLRCGHEFEFCPEEIDFRGEKEIQIKCPKCGTGYIRKIFTFPKGYSSQPHS